MPGRNEENNRAERRRVSKLPSLSSPFSRQSAINVAEGHKQSAILESEAVKMKQINHAVGKGQYAYFIVSM